MSPFVRGLAVLSVIAVLSGTASAQKLAPWDLSFAGQTGQHTTYLTDPLGGFCGLPVEIGDYDDDGFQDWAIAPILADTGPGGQRIDAGEIIVIAGNGVIGGVIDLANAPAGQPLLTIQGGASFDYAGTEMFSADVTGDGKTDLIVSASGADPNGRFTSGSVFVIPGGAGFGGVIDLAAPPPGVVRFDGADPSDRLGLWVEAGDFDGDGTDDVYMSADEADGPGNVGQDRGEAYVIYGGQTWPAVVDMRSPPPSLAYTVVYGAENGDQFGSCLHGVDLDSDGAEELVVSAAINRAIASNTGTPVGGGDGPANSRVDCGETFIVWGTMNARPTSIDLASPAPLLASGSLSIIYGEDAGDVLGEEITSGNLDGDAYRDLVLGALTADGPGNAKPYAGDVVVVYGGPSLRGQAVDLATAPAGTATIFGEDSIDIAGDTLSACDVNFDGFDDLLVAVPNADPDRPGVGVTINAGEVVVMFGGPVRWPVTQNLEDLDTETDIPSRRVFGVDLGDLAGYSMECADIDGDGFADLFPDSMRGDGAGNLYFDAGEVNIVSGERFSRGLVTMVTRPAIGSIVVFRHNAEPGFYYGAGFALAAMPSQPLPGGQQLFLAVDSLYLLSVAGTHTNFINTFGVIPGDGRGAYGFFVPFLPSIIGTRLFTAFATVDPADLTTVATSSASVSFVLEP